MRRRHGMTIITSIFLAAVLVLLPAFRSSAEDATKAFSGITIDGDFSDWEAVPKYGPHYPESPYSPGVIESYAAVWSGDNFYIYLHEYDGSNGSNRGYPWPGNITQSTPNNNGNFCITTDLNRTTAFEIDGNGVYQNGYSIPGASFKRKDHEYEISLPSSIIKNYNETVSFGIYQGDILVSDIVNQNPDPNHKTGTVSDISIDGNYSEWDFAKMQMIDYTTSGGHGSDGSGTLLLKDDKVYGYVTCDKKTWGSNPFTPFTVKVNGDDSMRLMLTAVKGNQDGSIDSWQTMDGYIGSGTGIYYLFDTSAPKDDINSTDSQTGRPYYYGRIALTMNSDGTGQAEFELDTKRLAEHFGLDGINSIKMVECNFQDIGNQWISAAGTPTGSLGAVSIPVLVTGLYLFFHRKKKMKGLPV
jgi:hypothetical protein